MSKKDLIPLGRGLRPLQEEKMIQVAGGSVCSPAKKLAARIRGLAWITDKEKKSLAVQKILDLLGDSRISGFELLRFAESLKDESLNNSQKIMLLGMLNNLHKTIHGSKIEFIESGDMRAREVVQRFFSGDENVLDSL